MYRIDCSKITGADSNKMSKNSGCQIAYFSKLRVREPMANKDPVLYRYLVLGQLPGIHRILDLYCLALTDFEVLNERRKFNLYLDRVEPNVTY
jgi:hypothetical protein